MATAKNAQKKRARTTVPEGESARTCIGCGVSVSPDELVRLVLAEGPDGIASVVPDAKGGAFGHGAHVHPSPSCLAVACRKGLPRAWKREVRVDPAALAKDITSAFTRRLEGLLHGGIRGGLVVFGGDAVAESVTKGEAVLLLVAADAAAAARRSVVVKMTEAGKSLVFGDKRGLARALGRTTIKADGTSDERDGVAVCAVTNVALATAVRRAWLCAVGLSTTAVPVTSPIDGSPRSPSEAEA